MKILCIIIIGSQKKYSFYRYKFIENYSKKKSITKENSKVINEHFYSFNNILYCESSYLKNFSFNKVFKLFELWRNNNFITGLSIQLMLKIWQFTKSSSNLDILTKQNKKIFLNFF